MNQKMKRQKYETIEEYIVDFPENIREALQNLRRVIKRTAPGAEEAINYGIPTFKLNGNLVHFAAFKKRVGFYPNPSAIEAFKNELSAYEISKGSVKFPLDKPIPFDIIEEIVKFRVKEALGKND